MSLTVDERAAGEYCINLDGTSGNWSDDIVYAFLAGCKHKKAEIKMLREALEYIEHRTNPDRQYSRVHPDGYFKSKKMRSVVLRALSPFGNIEQKLESTCDCGDIFDSAWELQEHKKMVHR